MREPSCTVVMPAHNTEDTIEAAIRSVIAQTRPDFELVVVDDGSTDGTALVVERLARDSRIRLLRQENKGAAAARNAALVAARGRYISFLDSDDLWLPTYLEVMVDALVQAPHAGFAYTDAWTFDLASRRIGTATAMEWERPPATPPADAEELLLALLKRNFVYTAVTVPRIVFERVGLFNPSLQAAIDYEMWLRIAACGYVAVRPPGLQAVYARRRIGSISSNRAVVLASLAGVYDRVGSDPTISSRARELALKRAATVRAELAAAEGRGGLSGLWRARVRPSLIRVRNSVSRRDSWRATPPQELADVFPELLVGSGDSTNADL